MKVDLFGNGLSTAVPPEVRAFQPASETQDCCWEGIPERGSGQRPMRHRSCQSWLLANSLSILRLYGDGNTRTRRRSLATCGMLLDSCLIGLALMSTKKPGVSMKTIAVLTSSICLQELSNFVLKASGDF
jgi:hypothetical protein